MIIDTRDSEVYPKERFDVCIVGAGAVGITIALELTSRNDIKVALLEAGGWSHQRQAQDTYRGELVGDRYPPLFRARYSGLGGSTELWAGWCRPLEELDFAHRAWVPNSGWPIGKSDLTDPYRRANAWCGLGQTGYGLEEWEEHFRGDALAPDTEIVDHVFQVRRFRFKDAYREQLETSAKVSVFLNATTLRLNSTENDGHITTALIQLGNGRSMNLPADQFILAAGGLENPRLMLLSGECPERALGNERDLVGRYFIEHGFVDSGTFLPSKQTSDLRRYFPVLHPHDPLHGTARPVLSLAPETLASEQLLNAALYFYPGYESHPVFDRRSIKSVMEIWEILKGRAVPGDWSNLLKSAFSRPFAVAHAMTRRAFASKPSQQGWRIRCYYECVPNAKNRMVLTQERDAFDRPRGRLIWRLGDQDLDSVHRFHQVFNKALARAGEGELFFPSDAAVWRERTESGKHPMGTTRMHDSPSHGVVDRNCKVHSCANLYIGGSSVFPAAGYANPTLTIVALATRLADHLASISERRSKPCQS